MKFSRISKALGTFSAITSMAYVHHVETSPSMFQKAGYELKLNDDQLSSMVDIFRMAGYLEPKKLHDDIHRMHVFENPKKTFNAINNQVQQHKNDPDSLKNNLFGRSAHYFWEKPEVTDKQVQDWILYVAQNAFARQKNQERSELKSENWMQTHQKEYIEAARKFGLIDRINPDLEQYDECWIMGASRPGVFARAIDLKHLLNTVKINGKIVILAGARPLWSEIDGISPKILALLEETLKNNTDIDLIKTKISSIPPNETVIEGNKYIIGLASKLNIALNPENPLIKYTSTSECPKGFFPGRTYPNYVDIKGPKLDETAMSKDVLDYVFGNNIVSIIDTQATDSRPNTATTAQDAAKSLIATIEANNPNTENKEYHVLVQSNQPYVWRQTLASQREINKALFSKAFKITLHGAGFSAKQDPETINSEFAALISELWKNANPNNIIKHLLYQERDNHSEVPSYSAEVSSLGKTTETSDSLD